MTGPRFTTLRAVAEAEVECGGQKTRIRGLDTLMLLDIAEAAEDLLDWIERQGPAPFSTIDHNFSARVARLRRASHSHPVTRP